MPTSTSWSGWLGVTEHLGMIKCVRLKHVSDFRLVLVPGNTQGKVMLCYSQSKDSIHNRTAYGKRMQFDHDFRNLEYMEFLEGNVISNMTFRGSFTCSRNHSITFSKSLY